MLLDNVAKEKRYFKTGNGTQINYSFVPAICQKLYIDWVKTVQSVIALQEETMTEKDNARLTEIAEKLSLEAEMLTNTRDKIITFILKNNEQKFKIEDDISYHIMSVDDMNRLVQAACGYETSADKKK